MKISDFPQDLEPRVGDILEIEQGDVCFEVRIIGITADGYLCEQDNVQGAVLLEGVALDHDDVADITGYITEEKVRLDPKCWKGKKIGNPKTKIKGGVRVNNCVPEGQQEDIEEAGPFSYGYKPPRKGSVAYWAEKKRKEQEKGKPPIEPKDQMVGVAKVTKGVSEGSLNEVTQGVEHSEWADNVKDHYHPTPVRIIKKRSEDGRHIGSHAMVADKKVGQYNMKTGVGTFTAHKKQGVAEDNEQKYRVTYDIYSSNREKPLYTKTRTVRADSEEEAIKIIQDLIGGRNHRIEKGVAEGEGKTQKYEMMMRNGQVKKFVAKDDADAKRIAAGHGAKSVIRLRGGVPAGKVAEQGVSEAKSLKKRVRVVQGEHAGKTGWIREIKHGIHSTAPKRYYVDIDGGGQADNLPASALRLMKDQSDSQKGMAEGGYPSPHNYDSDEDYYAAVDRYNRPKGPRPGDDDWEEYAPGDDIPSRRRHRDDDMDEAKYQGREVPLGKKMAGDVAKSKVYVRKPNGKVVKVNFGDKNMTIKKSNPKRRKSFRARHNCDNPGPRWKARYWSCRSW